jgi:hypothetical protein
MKYLTPIGIALLINPVLLALALAFWHPAIALLLWLSPPIMVLLALPFAKWDETASVDSNGKVPTIRGDLPGWAAWLGTPNERLPGGTYEPAVASVMARYGRFACAWYWLGLRNPLYGLSAAFGTPIDEPWSLAFGYQEKGNLWWLRHPILGNRFQIKAGYRCYFIRGQWLAVPCATITKA